MHKKHLTKLMHLQLKKYSPQQTVN